MPEESTPLSRLKTAAAIVATFLGLLASLFFIEQLIDWRVQSILDSSQTQEKLASLVRPSLIFDAAGRHLLDLGAGRYVDSTAYVSGGYSSAVQESPHQITVYFNRPVNSAPVIQSLDRLESVHASKGVGNSWVFELYDKGTITTQRAVRPPNIPARYRLEVIP